MTKKQFFSAVQGRFFFAKWMKKDGKIRQGVFRLGVQAHTKGGTLPYKPKDYQLQLVWEPAKCKGDDPGYRMIYIPQILELRSGKLRYSATLDPVFQSIIDSFRAASEEAAQKAHMIDHDE